MSRGLLPGIVAILAFALTLPLTRIAVLDTTPLLVFVVRLVLAATAATVVLSLARVPVPARRDWLSFLVVTAGVVFGFPLFSALAMDSEAAAHGGVVLGILPMATAIGGVLINRERPSISFWLIALTGGALVMLFSWLRGGGEISGSDIYLLLAIVSAAAGYTAGARLSLKMPPWQVISWALAPTLPIGLIILGFIDWSELSTASSSVSWLACILYLGLISQYGGFLLWYRALVLDGIARAGQLQLLQPFFTLIASYFLLGESIDLLTIGFAILILFSVILSRQAPMRQGARAEECKQSLEAQ